MIDLKKIKSIELKKSERIMIIAFIFFSIFGFSKYWFLVQANKLSEMKIQISTIKEHQVMNHQTLSGLQSNLNSISSTNPMEKNNTYLESIKSVNNISKMLETVVEGAASEVFTLNKISLESSITKNKIRTSHFNLEVNSSFIGLANFLDKLEKNSTWIAIESIELDRIKRDLRECQGIIKVITYELIGEE